ncbi:MAG: hypothetical protein IH820_17535 [Bacteroidetes bacterium]|nr:hypothetical protein [Bacteroidota bacterium]
MTRIATIIAFLALFCTLSTAAYAGPDGDDVKKAKTEAEAKAALVASEAAAIDDATWKAFSTNLVHALKMDNDGVKVAAMQYIIRYGDKLDVGAAVFDVMGIYRNHNDDNVRRMAVVALGRMQSDGAIGFLRLFMEYEKSESVLHTIQAVVSEYETAKIGLTAKIGA